MIKSSKIPDNSRSWVDLQIFDSFIMDTNCGKLLECSRCSISSFKSTHRTILDETIYRFKDFGESWKYFIKINENLHNISKELAIWYLLSKNDVRHLYFDRDPLPFGTLIMPLDFKLPLLYRKALTLNTGVVPNMYRHRSTNNNAFKNNPYFIEYDNISKSFYNLLLKKLQFVDESSRPIPSWVGYNPWQEKSFTALDLCIKTIKKFNESKKDEN